MSEEPEKTPAAAEHTAKMRNASLAASVSNKERALKSSNASEFVKFTRAAIEFQIFNLQAQLQLLDGLASLSDEEKLKLIFGLCDEDGDGKIDARELASAIRRVRADVTFQESLQSAIERIAIFDENEDNKLDEAEFKKFVDTMCEIVGMDFHELAELLVIQVMFAQGNTLEEEVAGYIAQDTGVVDEAIKAEKTLNKGLLDERMMALFVLFDLNGDGSVDFKEIALGLNKITKDMDSSAKAAIGALIMFDKNDERKLDYEQFTVLILNIVAASGADVKFEDVADAMTRAAAEPAVVSEEELAELLIADEMYNGLKELQQVEKDITAAIDILEYGRMQRLFQLWDLDNDGSLDVAELVLGLRKLDEGKGQKLATSVEDAIALILAFDEDGDAKLDPTEFAVTLVKLSQELKMDLHELVDFMVVISALKDSEPAEKEFLAANVKSVTEQIVAVEKELDRLAIEGVAPPAAIEGEAPAEGGEDSGEKAAES